MRGNVFELCNLVRVGFCAIVRVFDFFGIHFSRFFSRIHDDLNLFGIVHCLDFGCFEIGRDLCHLSVNEGVYVFLCLSDGCGYFFLVEILVEFCLNFVVSRLRVLAGNRNIDFVFAGFDVAGYQKSCFLGHLNEGFYSGFLVFAHEHVGGQDEVALFVERVYGDNHVVGVKHELHFRVKRHGHDGGISRFVFRIRTCGERENRAAKHCREHEAYKFFHFSTSPFLNFYDAFRAAFLFAFCPKNMRLSIEK